MHVFYGIEHSDAWVISELESEKRKSHWKIIMWKCSIMMDRWMGCMCARACPLVKAWICIVILSFSRFIWRCSPICLSLALLSIVRRIHICTHRMRTYIQAKSYTHRTIYYIYYTILPTTLFYPSNRRIYKYPIYIS